MFHFAISSFWLLCGVICLLLTLIILFCIIDFTRNIFRKIFQSLKPTNKHNDNRKIDIPQFDDYTENEDGTVWSQICKNCVVKHKVNGSLLDSAGSGICGVLGGENEADYYLDFPSQGEGTII